MTTVPPDRDALMKGLPAAAIALVAVTDVLLGQDAVLAGLVVVAPLLAASLAGVATTAAYGVVAVIVALLLGIYDGLYVPGPVLAGQVIRVVFIAVMSAAAVLLARDRIRRQERFTQVVKVAEAAQRAILLPVPDQLGPARVAVHYESAATDALIGGDLYGMVLTPFGLRVLVGDVRGKGLGAVRMSAQVLATFRERAMDHPDLAVLMGHMDHTVERAAVDLEDFVTAVLLQMDADGVVTLANAGHPAPFVLTEGRVRPAEPVSARPPLGLGGPPSDTTRLTLQPGDRVLLYTDGLTEARDPRSRAFLSPQIIVGALATDREVGDALAALRDDVLQWSGGTLNDDLALVLVEYSAKPALDAHQHQVIDLTAAASVHP